MIIILFVYVGWLGLLNQAEMLSSHHLTQHCQPRAGLTHRTYIGEERSEHVS